MDARKTLGRLLDKKDPRSICPVNWLVVVLGSLSEVLCCVPVLFTFSTVGKHIVLELFLSVPTVPSFPSVSSEQPFAPLPASLLSTAVEVRLCLACHRQWNPTIASMTATNTTAVRNIATEEASNAMLEEMPDVVVVDFSSGLEKWKGSSRRGIGDLVALGPSDWSWILHLICSWNCRAVRSNCVCTCM